MELLARVREVTLHAYDSQQIPFEKLVEELKPERKLNRNPFFDISFSLQNFPMPAVNFPDLEVELLRIDNGTSKFDLSIALVESQGGLATTLEYSTDLFDASTASRLLRNYTTLLEGVAHDPGRRISQYSILSDVEREQILRTWNATAVEYPRDRRVEDLFTEQARRTPQAVAVEFGEQALRYGELDDQSDRLAHYLRSLGVRGGANVAICAEPSTKMIVGLLGILKAKAAYVPIDPKYPEERIFDHAHGEPRRTCSDSIKRSHRGFRNRDQDRVPGGMLAARRQLSMAVRGNLCTAGGCSLHALYLRIDGNTQRSLCVPPGDHPPRSQLRLRESQCGGRGGQVSNCSFDAATFEIWGALLNGSRLVGIEHEDLLSAQSFAAELARHGVTTLFLTTAVFNDLPTSVRIFFAAAQCSLWRRRGDPGAVWKVLKSGPPQRLLNVYGPTETTTFATWYHIKDEQTVPRIPIGRPIANTQVYILDPNSTPCPLG